MKKVTAWYVVLSDGEVEFNHLEDGWSLEGFPQAITPEQRKAWENKKWMKIARFLDANNKVVEASQVVDWPEE